MAEKTISPDDLRELIETGAIIKKDYRPMVIEQFGELIDQMKRILDGKEERDRVDLARHQTNLEILATLQALVKKPINNGAAPAVEKQLRTVMEEFEKKDFEYEPEVKPAYDFEIKRDGRGFISGMKATPVQPTRH